MTYDPARHHRRSIRLKGYDYTRAGAYFITIVTQDHTCLFGEIVNGEMRLNDAGHIVRHAWQWLAKQYDHVTLDEWVVMPNHLHGIVMIIDDRDGRGGSRTAPTATSTKRKPLGRLIGAFKTVSTKRINEIRRTPGATVWQRNYYEHIIRNDESLHRIREYILNNPAQWAMDRENPQAHPPQGEHTWRI